MKVVTRICESIKLDKSEYKMIENFQDLFHDISRNVSTEELEELIDAIMEGLNVLLERYVGD